jgi:hypothetical protein
VVHLSQRLLRPFLQRRGLSDIAHEVHQFLVVLVLVKGDDRYSVLQLVEVGVGSVIDEKHIL